MRITKVLDTNPYIVADPHFLHANITRLANRPENWQDILLENWNNLVSDNDYIFILGDLFMGTKKQIREFMENTQLNGKKVLLIGNHDGYSDNFYASLGIKAIRHYIQNGAFLRNAVKWKNIILSHYPLIPIPNVKYNIHGHVHNNSFERREKRHINVSVETLEYMPIRLGDINYE
jgi:calcineurin-like phosphoesterase family protein